MQKELFTTQQYLDAIKREECKRATTYPKIIQKMIKRGTTEEEVQQTYLQQNEQMRLLKYSSIVLSQGRTVLDYAFINEMLTELMRELKERKRHYPRWVKFYKMMTQETADYEIQVWESLTRYVAKEFLGLDELPTKRRKKQ